MIKNVHIHEVEALVLEPVEDSPFFVRPESAIRDHSGQFVSGLRFDLRWVSVSDAIKAVRSTDLANMVKGRSAGEPVADILVTLDITAHGGVIFLVTSAEGRQFKIWYGARDKGVRRYPSST